MWSDSSDSTLDPPFAFLTGDGRDCRFAGRSGDFCAFFELPSKTSMGSSEVSGDEGDFCRFAGRLEGFWGDFDFFLIALSSASEPSVSEIFWSRIKFSTGFPFLFERNWQGFSSEQLSAKDNAKWSIHLRR